MKCRHSTAAVCVVSVYRYDIVANSPDLSWIVQEMNTLSRKAVILSRFTMILMNLLFVWHG